MPLASSDPVTTEERAGFGPLSVRLRWPLGGLKKILSQSGRRYSFTPFAHIPRPLAPRQAKVFQAIEVTQHQEGNQPQAGQSAMIFRALIPAGSASSENWGT